MPLADGEGVGAADRGTREPGGGQHCARVGMAMGCADYWDMSRSSRRNGTKERGQVAKAPRYRGAEWGPFKTIRDPQYFSAADFDFRQNLMESDCIKLIRAEVLGS